MSVAKVYIEHGSYGCDTGCCGRSLDLVLPEVVPWDGWRRREWFFLEHPLVGDDPLAFGHYLVRMAMENAKAAREMVEACGGYELESVEMRDD